MLLEQSIEGDGGSVCLHRHVAHDGFYRLTALLGPMADTTDSPVLILRRDDSVDAEHRRSTHPTIPTIIAILSLSGSARHKFWRASPLLQYRRQNTKQVKTTMRRTMTTKEIGER